MKAIEIADFDGPEQLRMVERPDPRPGPREVVIAVTAAGVNRPDVIQRRGAYPPPEGVTDIPGLEVSGRIAAVGPEVEDWREGDAVCALVAGGGYGAYCLAPVETVLPAPQALPLAHAAGLPETVFTVWSNVFERGYLDSGEWLLCHGGSSGIGTIAIQLAKAFAAHVVVTAGSEEKCAFCRQLGADRAVNYRDADFVAAAREATGGRGVDVVLDMVGGHYLPRNLKALGPDGRHVSIAFLEGRSGEIDIAQVMFKRLTLTGSGLRGRSNAFKGAVAQAVHRLVWPEIEAGRVAPVVDSSFALADAAEAHARMESGAHMGKILLTP